MIPHRPALALAAGLILCGPLHAQLHDPHNTTCVAVRGTLVPECNAAICNQGRVTGDLQGRFSSRVTSIYPAGSGWLYSSWTRFELDGKKGRIETADEGTMPPAADGGPDRAQAAQLLVLSEATGKYQDYSGTLVMTGGHAIGQATAYSGRLCRRMAPG